MRCTICKLGECREGFTAVTLTRGESTIVVKTVPADICQNCGNYYLSDQVSMQIMKLAEHSIQSNAEVDVIAYVS